MEARRPAAGSDVRLGDDSNRGGDAARKIAPGLKRDFQFMNWPGFEREIWYQLLEQRAQRRSFFPASCWTDRDAGAVQAAAHNAERAGVAENVRFFQEAVSGSIEGIDSAVGGTGWVLTNPPYGVRVGEAGDLRNLYAKLGTTLGEKAGWRLGVPAADLVSFAKVSFRSGHGSAHQMVGFRLLFFASEKT